MSLGANLFWRGTMEVSINGRLCHVIHWPRFIIGIYKSRAPQKYDHFNFACLVCLHVVSDSTRFFSNPVFFALLTFPTINLSFSWNRKKSYY